MNGMFYKALQFIVSETVLNLVLSLTLDRALYVGRHDFGSVNPEIRIIEGRITEVLLYIKSKSKYHCFSGNTAGCHRLMEDRFNNNLELFCFLSSYK